MPIAPTHKVRRDLMIAFFSNTFDKIIGYVIILLIARQLSQDAVGEIFYAIALVAVVALFTNIGTGGFLTRAVAQEPNRATYHLSSILSVRLVLLILFLTGLNLLILVFRPELTQTIVLTSIYIGLEELFYTFSSLFLGLRIIAYRIAVSVLSKLLLILMVAIVLANQPTVANVLWSHVIAYTIQLGLIYLVSRNKVGPVWWQWDWSANVELVRHTWPFLSLLVLSMLLSKVDVFMLEGFHSLAMVAIYEAAYKFLEVSRFVLRPIRQIYFPIYSEMSAKQQKAALRREVGRALGLAVLAGLAGSVFVMIFGEWLIISVFGDRYTASIPVIRVLFWAAPALYVGFICQFLAIALHLERQAVRLLVIGVVLKIAMNALVLPQWSALGAAGTTVVTEFLMAALLFQLCWSRLRQMTVPPEAGAVELAPLFLPDEN